MEIKTFFTLSSLQSRCIHSGNSSEDSEVEGGDDESVLADVFVVVVLGVFSSDDSSE